MGLTIRPARRGDVPTVLELVKALAAYEERSHEVVADEAALAAAMFGDVAFVLCDLAEVDGVCVGFALYHRTISTFSGKSGFYLEDLFVDPAARGQGIGKALLARLARRCLDEGGGRLDWSVLTWNMPAIRFYETFGATRVEDWHVMKIDGEALERLARTAPGLA